MIVKISGRPKHGIPPLVNVGVTVIVASTGDPLEFLAVNKGIDPFPEAPSPILVLVFDQL